MDDTSPACSDIGYAAATYIWQPKTKGDPNVRGMTLGYHAHEKELYLISAINLNVSRWAHL